MKLDTLTLILAILVFFSGLTFATAEPEPQYNLDEEADRLDEMSDTEFAVYAASWNDDTYSEEPALTREDVLTQMEERNTGNSHLRVILGSAVALLGVYGLVRADMAQR